MGNVRTFIQEQRNHEKKLAEFLGWEFIEEQKKGTAFDCITPEGEKVEMKLDWGSKVTGNHYLEFEQKSHYSASWVPSGFSLSKEQADIWLVANDDFVYLLKVEEVERMLEERKGEFETRTTRKRINNNRAGQFSRAYLVPLTILEEYAIEKIKSPIHNPKEYK